MKRLGLMTKYLTDDDFKLRVKMLSALAFVPVSDVVANFESLATTFLNDELPLLGYFESTWIGQSVGGRRLPPMFSHHMWNVLDELELGLQGKLMPLNHSTIHSTPCCPVLTLLFGSFLNPWKHSRTRPDHGC